MSRSRQPKHRHYGRTRCGLCSGLRATRRRALAGPLADLSELVVEDWPIRSPFEAAVYHEQLVSLGLEQRDEIDDDYPDWWDESEDWDYPEHLAGGGLIERTIEVGEEAAALQLERRLARHGWESVTPAAEHLVSSARAVD